MKPTFMQFIQELKLNSTLLSNIKNKKATKTCKLLK